MTNYEKLVEALRDTDFGDACDYCEHSDMCKDDDCIILQAADVIEALQAENPIVETVLEGNRWRNFNKNGSSRKRTQRT